MHKVFKQNCAKIDYQVNKIAEIKVNKNYLQSDKKNFLIWFVENLKTNKNDLNKMFATMDRY